jgi:hypothetical protein
LLWLSKQQIFPYSCTILPMTNSRGTALTAVRWLARALALAAAYFVIAKIGLRYATIGPSISLVWPPTGLAVATGRGISPEAVHSGRPGAQGSRAAR